MELTKEIFNYSNYPRNLSSIIISVGLLAASVTFTSWVLLSYPIGTAVRNYFNGFVETRDFGSSPTWQNVTSLGANNSNENTFSHKPGYDVIVDQTQPKTKRNISHSVTLGNQSSGASDARADEKENSLHRGSNQDNHPPPTTSAFDISQANQSSNESLAKTGCDLYHGHWFVDPSGPLYTNNTCPVISQRQNCQGNGRPDKEYEKWRWKPSQCDLPRFDGRKFLELMRGKTIAFIGDSVARNQMESLLCMLWQVEVPKNRGNRQMKRWHFRLKSVTIIRIWSSWLVHNSPEQFSYAPQGVDKVYLDIPDETFMQHLPKFDVVVLSSGHWFVKQSVYIMNNEIVGTQLWEPPEETRDLKRRVNRIEAFGISVETILTAMATHPNYTGLTIVRSYSPDHYEGGAWNTGGSCTGKKEPLSPGKLVENEVTNKMHEKQVMGFDRAAVKVGVKGAASSRFIIMDITEAFSYRHDGHPGPYRDPDPNKKTERDPDGRPPPQDCLHWCMPGPVDTWNELLLEIIRRKFEGLERSNQ